MGRGTHGSSYPRRSARENAMTYLIEIQNPSGPLVYVIAQGETRQDAAHAVIDAQLERDDADDDIVIVAVHTIH
jgi:hypothetical protein